MALPPRLAGRLVVISSERGALARRRRADNAATRCGHGVPRAVRPHERPVGTPSVQTAPDPEQPKPRITCRATTEPTGNVLYYGDNLDMLSRHVADESVDLVYLDSTRTPAASRPT